MSVDEDEADGGPAAEIHHNAIGTNRPIDTRSTDGLTLPNCINEATCNPGQEGKTFALFATHTGHVAYPSHPLLVTLQI